MPSHGVTVRGPSGAAYDDNWRAIWNSAGTLTPSAVGSWWPSADRTETRTSVNCLTFEGTGYLDDLEFSTRNPFTARHGSILVMK